MTKLLLIGIKDLKLMFRDRAALTFMLLAPFLLTNLLLPTVRASAPARIVNVASHAHYSGRMRWDDPGFERGYRDFRAYCQSKLANVLFSNELARRLDGTRVTANALHPGVIATNFAMDEPGLFRLAFRLVRPFLLSPESGARTSVFLASSPTGDAVTGKYFARCKEVQPSAQARDVGAQRRLWDLTEQMTKFAAKRPAPK